jgi:hypothetical protein
MFRKYLIGSSGDLLSKHLSPLVLSKSHFSIEYGSTMEGLTNVSSFTIFRDLTAPEQTIQISTLIRYGDPQPGDTVFLVIPKWRYVK